MKPPPLRLPGACAALLGVSYLLLGAWYLAMPPEQQSNAPTARFFLSLAADPTPARVQFALAGVGALLAFGVVPAVSALVRATNPFLVRWTSNLAYLGLAAIFLDCARFVFLQPRRAQMFASGDEALRRAIQANDSLLYLDAGGFAWGLLGLWVLTVAVLGWRSRVLPRPLAAIGAGLGCAYLALMGGYSTGSGVLFLAGAGLGGLVLAPGWYIWLGLLLWRRPGPVPSGGRVEPSPQAQGVERWPATVGQGVPPPVDARATLARSAVFAALPEAARIELAGRMRRVEAPSGTVLVREGEEGDSYYLLAEGQAEVWVSRGLAARAESGPGEGGWTPDPNRHTLLACLGPGQGFGEMALLLGGTRRATVRAGTPLVAFVLDGETFRHVVDEHRGLLGKLDEELALRGVAAFLGRSSPFGRLDPQALHWVAQRFKRERVEAGRDLVRQGEAGDAFYLVRSGRAAVLVRDADGSERQVATLGPGDPFGEQALLTSEPRSATVRALEPMEALRLERDDFREVIAQYRDRATYFFQLTTQRQRPRRIEHWVMEKTTVRGVEQYVLKDTRNHRYALLNEQGAFLWDLMDGQHTVRDLVQAYFKQYRVIGMDAVLSMMLELSTAGFVKIQRLSLQDLATSGYLSPLQRLLVAVQPWIIRYFSLPDLDRALTWLYHTVLWPLYSRPAQLGLLGATLAGAALFLAGLAGGTIQLPSGSAATLAASGWVGFLLQGLLHELGHAATTKHFGREVHRAGVGWYFFLPVGYVDTSDMWLENKWRRMATAFAGPYVNFILSGLATVAASLVPDDSWRLALLQFAVTGYTLGMINMNPLLEWDGYYVLMDWLEVPNLRANALAFLGGALAGAGRTTHDPRLVRIYWSYGALTLAYTLFVAWLVLTGFSTALQQVLGAILPPAAVAPLGWLAAGAMCWLILRRAWQELRAGVERARKRRGAEAQREGIPALR